MALELFLKSYDVDPVASMPLLARLLNRDRLATHGPYEFVTLGYNFKHIRNLEAIELIYKVVFSKIKQPDGQVDIGGNSAIMAFSQAANQPLKTARYALASEFEHVLSLDPHLAVRALTFAIDNAEDLSRERKHYMFTIDGNYCGFYSDQTSLRKSGPYEDWQRMKDRFEVSLVGALKNGDSRYVDAIIVASKCKEVPTMFLKILLCNARYDKALARKLQLVVTSVELLRGYEFAAEICEYLASAFTLLARKARVDIELALQRLPRDDSEGDKKSWYDERLEIYLSAIPVEALSIQALIEKRRIALKSNFSEKDRSLSLNGTYLYPSTFKKPRLTDRFDRAGNDTALIDLLDEAAKIMPINGPPSDPLRLLPLSRQFHSMLDQLKGDIYELTLDLAIALIEYAHRFQVATIDEILEFGSLILISALGTHPKENAAYDPNDETITSGWPNARQLAASLLGRFYFATESQEYLDALLLLSKDPVPSVRHEALNSASQIAIKDAQFVWGIVEATSSDESLGVKSMAHSVACNLYRLDPARFHRFELHLFDDLVDHHPDSQLKFHLERNLLLRFLEGDREADKRLRNVIEMPWLDGARGKHIALSLVNLLPTENVAIRAAACGLLTSMVTLINNELRVSGNLLGKSENQVYRVEPAELSRIACVEIITSIAERLYFDSGAYDGSSTPSIDDETPFSIEYFKFLEPVLTELALLPYTTISYNVIKILHKAIALNAESVLKIARRAFESGISANLAYEPLAQQAGACFIRVYMLNHRGLLNSSREALATVLNIIDAFADAGWPEWTDLVLMLNDLFHE